MKRDLLLIIFFLVVLSILIPGSKQVQSIIFDVLTILIDKQQGKGFMIDLSRLVYTEIIWLIGFVLVTILVKVFIASNSNLNRFLDYSINYKWVILFSALVILFISNYVLLGFPNSSDEYVYLFQGETLSDFRFHDSPHPLRQFFNFNHLFQSDQIWIGRFPPGWPLILALAILLHVPLFLVNLIIGIITLFVFYKFVKTRYNSKIAFWSLLILGSSSFFIFNSASFFSHTLALLCSLLFAICLLKALDGNRPNFAFIAGVFIGLSFITRYYSAILFALPFGFYLFKYNIKVVSKVLLFTIIGFIPFLFFLFYYNYKITGNPFLPVTVWIDAHEGLGFVKGHNLKIACEHIVRRLLLFEYWVSPGMLFLYFLLLYHKFRSTEKLFSNPEDWMFVVFIFGYVFYHEIGGNQYGPRFYYEAFPFMIVFVVSRISVFADDSIFRAMLFTCVIFSFVKMPFIGYRENKIIKERTDLYRIVNESGIDNAVVLVSSGTSVIRPMPIGDLIRNDKLYQNQVIYARDLGPENELLFSYYNTRTFYRYIRDLNQPKGKLIPINH